MDQGDRFRDPRSLPNFRDNRTGSVDWIRGTGSVDRMDRGDRFRDPTSFPFFGTGPPLFLEDHKKSNRDGSV